MSEEMQQEVKERVENSSDTSATQKTKKKTSSAGLWGVVLLVVLVGGYVVYDRLQQSDEGTPSTSQGEDSSKVIATVNGEAITQGDLNAKIEQVRSSLPAGTNDPTEDAAFELQLLDDLINLKLLTTTAINKNYTVSNDEIEAEKVILIERFGGEEAFNQQLEMLGVSQEELNENMRNELLIRQLLEDETDVESVAVSDEEVAATYAIAVGDAEDAPELEQVADLIRSELINQKTGQIIEAYINELRAGATIEKNL